MRASTRAETEPWSSAAADDERPHVHDRSSPTLPFADTAIAVATLMFGPYLIEDTLGAGRLSIVHRARDTRSSLHGAGGAIALKRLNAAHATNWQMVEAFLGEARVGHQLDHPNLARTFDYGKLDDTYYAASELALGPTLAQVMIQSRTAAGAIPTHVVVELVLQLCDAVDHLHTRTPAVIHRDIAPANLVVTARGQLKLIDFGVAKTAARRQIRRRMVRGTPGYVAPEYLDGELDERADLFAIGAIAHELLVGQPLFAADSEARSLANVRGKVVQRPSRWAPEIPRELDDIVVAALRRDPSSRWQTAGAMRSALARLAARLGGRAALARDVTAWLAWAFERMPRRDSQVRDLVDALEADWLAAGARAPTADRE